MARRGKGKVQKEGSSRTGQVLQTLVPPQQLIDKDLPLNPNLDSESLENEGSGGEKKKGRGKAKGVPNNHNLEVHIYQGRIVTPEVVREISILFSQNIIGHWIRYTEYPEDERETLFARFKEIKFAYTCTEEELKAAMLKTCSILFKDWMFLLRKKIFKKYLTKEAQKAHPPNNVPVKVWEKMVDKWMDEDWQERSQRNKSNRDYLKMHHTAGSIPIAKYKYEQGLNLVQLSVLKCFICQKQRTATLEAKKASAQDQGLETDELDIYREVVGEGSHGRVLGMGSGIKAKDVYGYCERSCKRARVDKTEELELKIKNMEEELQQYKAMKDELEQLKATQEEVKQMRELMKVMMSQSNIQLPPTTADVSPNCLDNGVEHTMHD
ncbi:hypothetical protein LWI29_023128 [Acer saccharum]|uniref:Transposase, Ptta/En/Spm, plant n=1 Tax=Acer saccharum TaxID=4024 RepID=A0AA39VCE2_ACESA|nr:hypothetical protein LWI29_023128 [Acer saccharum]